MKSIFMGTILSLTMSCNSISQDKKEIVGSWELIKTELYTDNELSGVLPADEITTVYIFERCQENKNCMLQIIEDGVIEEHSYTYLSDTDNLIIGTETYLVKRSNQELIIERSYAPYLSIYTFRKVE